MKRAMAGVCVIVIGVCTVATAQSVRDTRPWKKEIAKPATRPSAQTAATKAAAVPTTKPVAPTAARIEHSIQRATQYLIETQSADGSWGPGGETGPTGGASADPDGGRT